MGHATGDSRAVAGNHTTFDRRICSLGGFLRDVGWSLGHLGQVRRAMRLDKGFGKRIFLAVTQVNGCRYCAYVHARTALAAGLSQEEIARLLSGEFGEVPPAKAVGIAFAQHYAETAGKVDPSAWDRLAAVYGPDTAQDILVSIRLITLGNLWGNTLDALLYRFRGQPAPGSNPFSELAVVLIGVVGGGVGAVVGGVVIAATKLVLRSPVRRGDPDGSPL